MMSVDLIRTLYDYNYWAHELVWDAAQHLSNEAFFANTQFSWGSLHAQIIHTMNEEWMWFHRLQGESPDNALQPDKYPNRESIRAKWREIEAQVRTYINRLDDNQLQQMFTYTTSSGKQHRQSIGEILLHVINAGTDNRAQSITMLHILGAPTVEQGLIYYLRERQESK